MGVGVFRAPLQATATDLMVSPQAARPLIARHSLQNPIAFTETSGT